ncbi:unnamed protein product [Ceutorhynchus assimilis]|uniref:Stress-activated map kinase-interacting protein 1 n=1 Tax=Ceutorhynchus assimilis TaxID=467358 RepID=A0A9N9QNH0_9CUCU|nr:unnamed protein product [Ceutorhynchus assimilis]
MALYDNKYWLLSHIRNSFISTDDTGMCELVMKPETKQVKDTFFSQEPFPDSEDSEEDDDEDTGSYDIQLDTGYNLRERSMTAARLEKMEYMIRNAARIKHVKWECHSDQKDQELFVAKQTKHDPIIEKKSGLSKIIKETVNMPVNPFIDYARYDGVGQIKIPTRKYNIFLTMLPEDQRNYPINVCCVASAKIQDLIGLILLKCSTNYDYSLKPLHYYGLYLTEDNGEVDHDFPGLDNKECVAKFGFTYLGLVEHKEPLKAISLEPEGTPTSSESGKKRTTSSSKAEENKQMKQDMMILDGHNKAMEAPLFKLYRAHIVNKLWWWKVEVHIGISGEKIEIDPIVHKNSKLPFVKQIPVSHNMDCIAWCEETDTRGSKGSFRIVYATGFGSERNNPYSSNYSSFNLSSSLQSSSSFKHYDFEADKEVTEEIVQKINLILNLRTSQSRMEYLAIRERKDMNKRKSFKYLRS